MRLYEGIDCQLPIILIDSFHSQLAQLLEVCVTRTRRPCSLEVDRCLTFFGSTEPVLSQAVLVLCQYAIALFRFLCNRLTRNSKAG